jgi:hypothetical protein
MVIIKKNNKKWSKMMITSKILIEKHLIMITTKFQNYNKS